MREAKELNEPTELYYAQPLEVKDRCDREFVQNIIYENWISLYIFAFINKFICYRLQ